MSRIITEGFQELDWAILKLPDGGERLVQVKSQELVDLGRFGRFPGKHLVGKLPGHYFNIEPDGELVEADAKDLLDAAEGGEVSEVVGTNQDIFDHNTSQKLTTEDIESLKQQAASGQLKDKDLVAMVVQNSETFAQKNTFSQVKYLQRKQRKFMKWFGLVNPTIRTLASHYLQRDPRKVMDLRLDSLSQILCLANLQTEGGKFMIWEETLGVLSGAVLSKLGASSTLVHVHPGRQMQVPALMYYNLPEEVRNRLLGFQLAEIESTLDEQFYQDPTVDAARLAIQKERFFSRLEKKRTIQAWFKEARFDGLIVATNGHDPLHLMKTLSPYLIPSSKIVFYSSWRELLLPLYASLRRDDGFVDVAIAETWLRPYQAAPGRIHPNMNCNGNTGIILSATKVLPIPSRNHK